MGRLGLAIVGVAIVLTLAACGGQTTYASDRTKTCLTERGVRVGGKLDFVAGTATGGAFLAHLGDNYVTVAFGSTLKNGTDIETAYTRFALPNVRPGSATSSAATTTSSRSGTSTRRTATLR